MEIKKGYYRHFKGNIYQVICVAKHTEDESLLVVYKSVTDGKTWARPLEMWQETVERDGKKFQRFEFLGEEYE